MCVPRSLRPLALAALLTALWRLALGLAMAQAQTPYPVLEMSPPPVSDDPSIIMDYCLASTRSPRELPCPTCPQKKKTARWAEFSNPAAVNPGTDLVLTCPDRPEEVLVHGGPGAIQDPLVSFNAEFVYYTRFHQATGETNASGSDVYKVNIATKEETRLTQQRWCTDTPPLNQGVYHMHPAQLPGGKVMFVTNCNAYLPPSSSYIAWAWQLALLDEATGAIELIGAMNLGSALHPMVTKAGPVIFSTLENQGLRRAVLWGLWSILQDGTGWAPIISAFEVASGWHFTAQLSNGDILADLYYNTNQHGFGSLFRLPVTVPVGQTAFGPGDLLDPRNTPFTITGQRSLKRFPFTPYGLTPLTPWAIFSDHPAIPSVWNNPQSPRVGKLTHPAAAPDGHCLAVWSGPHPIGGASGTMQGIPPAVIDSGIYLIKDCAATAQPGDMFKVLDTPEWNEQWPKPVVPYKRLYGIDEPPVLVQARDTSQPVGWVGTSSFYRRESAPGGAVLAGTVTAVTPAKKWNANDFWNWRRQGSDAGRYENSEIYSVRLVEQLPNAWTPAPTPAGAPKKHYPPYLNHIGERLRILGEVPLRKGPDTPLDPDGHPDTSFLAKIPADVSFTFQTLDKDGLVLNMAQTWHQVRPGETRKDCGGCHAHSQIPTSFELTFAGQPGYVPYDATQPWPVRGAEGKPPQTPEFYTDIATQACSKVCKLPHNIR